MTLKPNSIITVENGKRYVLLNETYYEEEQYFLAMELNEKKEVITSNVAIFKGIKEKKDIYVEKVNNPELIVAITEQLKAQM